MVNFNPSQSDLERARARLGLTGGTQFASSPSTFGFEAVPEEDDGNFLQDVLGFVAEADRPLSERIGIELDGPLGFVLEELTRPSTLAIALGGAGLASKLGTTGIRGFAAQAIAPRGTNFITRLGATTAESVGARAASEAANEALEGAPTPIRIGAGIAGGILGAGAAAGALSRGARQAVGRDLFAAPDLSTGARVAAQPPRVVDRVGSLLSAPTARELGDYTVDQVIPRSTFNLRGRTVAENLGRQVEAQSERVVVRGRQALRKIGETVTGDDGNIYVRGLSRSDGGRAALQEVLEHPDRFPLTPAQRQGVEEFTDAFRTVRTERELFGVAPKEAELEEGQNFISRLRKTEPERKPRTGGTRLGGTADRAREYLDPAEAIANGIVYEDPLLALQSYTTKGLKQAADEHVISLLKPFSETSSMRVSPALRAQHDALQNRLRGLRDTHGRLDTRLRNTVDAYLNAAEPNLDELLVELDGIRVRGSGRNAGRNASEVAAEIERVKAEIKALRPEWKRELDRSRRVPAGRKTVPRDFAPGLSGRDFTPEAADRITSYYARGHTPPNALGTAIRKINNVNRAIVPLRAMGDMSAVLNQLAAIVPTNPLTFARNFGRALGDAIGNGQAYERYLVERGQDAAQHGVVILGRTADQVDFQFPTWFHRIPGIGNALNRLQRHFEAITTRNRIDIFNQYVDVAARRGQPLDDVAKEEIARALNRLSGISNSRANDVETLVEFAPNFLRSSLEVIDTALRDGTLEGQIARQYVRNLVVAGQLMVVGVAAAQGRDLREVTSPIDINAARRGELRMNSNFGTIRVLGQDVSVYGRFDSLARLAVVGMDAASRAIAEGDAREIGDFIGFLARSKGSPIVGATSDLVQGTTFEGNQPLSPASLYEYAAPFSVQEFINDGPLAAVVSFLGGKSSPLTPFEQLNAAAEQRFGRGLDELTGQERQALEADLPNLADRARRESERRANSGDPKAQARLEFDQITERRIDNERALMQAFQVGDIDQQQLGDALNELQFRAAVEREQTMRTLGVEFGDANSPERRALDAWFDTFEQAEIAPGVKDWDMRDALEAELFQRIAAGEFGDPARAMAQITDRAETRHAEEVQWFYDAKDVINQAGYYEVQDQIYQQFAGPASQFAGSQLLTYSDLVRAINIAERDGNTRLAIGLSRIRNRVDAVVQRQRQALRLRNPDLDTALVQARGLTPVRPFSLAQ